MYYTDITMPSLNVQDSTSLKIHIVLTFLIELCAVYFSDRIKNALPQITSSIVLTHDMVWKFDQHFAEVLINNTPVEMKGAISSD